MRVFLDANVLVSVLNKEYPLFPHSARILSLADQLRFQLYTTPICLAIAFYFAEKKCGTAQAKQKMQVLSSKLHIASVDSETVKNAVSNPSVMDFEDGLEYYSALQHDCKAIITEDSEGFYFSEIPVFDCRKFLEEVVF
ncbi:putative nucleic acid-binding protein [Algoriphagus aquaeductus]|jgi:predicted nucleic acid-binding protein|uniref:Putative nucleic acid-binding protein n=1 Tax=Algoriphagus aquaeductus TaxID=475299 RepID=A0A326RVY0_9BACT|nr:MULTISPECIES: PIN domain-containing protein [Algoriphagus]PZV85561.1 putative nucleic acid-binding protein [Algoriphagus aquaeductus]